MTGLGTCRKSEMGLPVQYWLMAAGVLLEDEREGHGRQEAFTGGGRLEGCLGCNRELLLGAVAPRCRSSVGLAKGHVELMSTWHEGNSGAINTPTTALPTFWAF